MIATRPATRAEINLTRELVTRLPSPLGLLVALAIGCVRWLVAR